MSNRTPYLADSSDADAATRFFTVRVAIDDPNFKASALYRNVPATDADHAASIAATAAEREFGYSGWVLDGPVEAEAA